VDLIRKLSELLDFDYEFMIVNGNGKYNPETKQWDGIIRKLIDHVGFFKKVTPMLNNYFTYPSACPNWRLRPDNHPTSTFCSGLYGALYAVGH